MSSSSSVAVGPRGSHNVPIEPTQALTMAAVSLPPPLQPSSPSSRLLQEIEETCKLLRAFRSLKERGASRAELADLHTRVKALKAAQQYQQQRDASGYTEVTPPLPTSATSDAAAMAHPSLVRPPGVSLSSAGAHRHAGIALHKGAPGWTAGSSHSSYPPQQQRQRGVEETPATHRDRRLPEGRHHHHRHRHHDARVDQAALSPISTGLLTTVVQAPAAVCSGAGNAVGSGSAGDRSAVARHPRAASPVAASLVRLNSMVFAITLAEAHTRREIAHRWERRWLRHWGNFKEGRIAIALRPPTSAVAALSPPQLQPERWAEAAPMALPSERQQRHQAGLTVATATEGNRIVTTTAAHHIVASSAPVQGWRIGEAFTATTSRLVAEDPPQTSSLSASHRGNDEGHRVARRQEQTTPEVDTSALEGDEVVGTTPPPQPHQQPTAPVTAQYSEANSRAAADAAAAEEAAAARALATQLAEAQAAAAEAEKTRLGKKAAERLAAAVRNVEDDEAAARTGTEWAAAEARERVKLAEVAARRRAKRAREAVQSLVAAEARARATLEDDEAHLMVSHVSAAAAAEAKSRQRAQEAATREAAAKREEEEERRAAAHRAAEAQRQAAADSEAVERRSVEQQWQAAICLSESLLAGWIKNTVAAAPQWTSSKGKRVSEWPTCNESAMEDAQAREAAEAQTRLCEWQQAAERSVAASSAAADAVLEEWVSAAATEAIARQCRAEQAARTAVVWANNEDSVALVASEEEAWQQLLLQHAADVEATHFVVRAAEEEAAASLKEMRVAKEAARAKAFEEAARLQAQQEVTAMADTLFSAVTELSKIIVDGCLAEAAEQMWNRAGVEELQVQQREGIKDNEVLARDDMYGDALDERRGLREEEAAAEVCKRIEVEAVSTTTELARQQQMRGQAAAPCLYLSELSEALLHEFLHDAAATAVATRAAAVTNDRFVEAPPPAALPQEEEGTARAAMEDEQEQQYHQPSPGDATDEPDALTEKAYSNSVDSPDKATVGTAAAAPETVAVTASVPLSPSSSADTTRSAVTATGVSQEHAKERPGLPSPTAFTRIVDDLLSGVLRDAATEARKGGGGAGGTVNMTVTSPTHAAQRTGRHRVAMPDQSDASFASVDSDGSYASSGRTPPQVLQPKPLALPHTAIVSGAAGDGVPQVQPTGGELGDGTGTHVADGTVSFAASPAEVSNADKHSPHRCIVSPLLMPSVSVAIANTTTTTLTASAVGGKGKGRVGGAAGVTPTMPSSSSSHYFSTASSADDDDDDVACSSLTATGAPLPLTLQHHNILSPLLSQRHGGGIDDESCVATTPAGSGAATDTPTAVALAIRSSSSEKSRERQQLQGSAAIGNRDATSDADVRLSAGLMMDRSTMGMTEDLCAFQLDAPLPPPPHGVTGHCAGASVPSGGSLSADAVAATATSLVQRIVCEAALLVASRGRLTKPNTNSDREMSCGTVKVDHTAAPPSLFSSAERHKQNTLGGKSSHKGISAFTSSSAACNSGGVSSFTRVGDDEAHAEEEANLAEISVGLTRADAREATLRVVRSSLPTMAAEGIAGAQAPLTSLPTLVSAVAAPNDFVARLRQPRTEKEAVEHQQNRYLTSRELALVSARYLTSEAAAARVMDVGSTATLSTCAVALALSVGLVRAATLANRRARRRVEEEAGKSDSSSTGTGGGGVLAGEKGSHKLTRGGEAALAVTESPDTPPPSMGGDDADGGTFSTGIIGEAGGGGGDLGMFGPTASSAVGNAAQARSSWAFPSHSPVAPVLPLSSESGKAEDTGMSDGTMALGIRSPSLQSSPSYRLVSKFTAVDDVKGALATSSAQQQTGVLDKLPAEWAAALRGVAERVARDFMDYASRRVLLGQVEGQWNQAHLHTARRIHSDALAGVNVHALFTQELQLRDVALLVYYYVELATNGPRERVEPCCVPAAHGEHNIFGRRSNGAVGDDNGVAAIGSVSNASRKDVTGFSHFNAASTAVLAPPTQLQPPSAFSRHLPQRSSNLLSATTAIHVRRAGLLHLVLEQCVSNVLNDLVGDTVGWLGTACLHAAPSGTALNGAQ
ncbi:kinetoplast-associated protein-like protein [Leishmania braziliensis MHOM/BR/75/M2904]|uniref:Kinetoplast-associated protein-like protein n=1 Tax=Leishmania braziliensis TaxID=5660 RepID=A4H499_LEIBR|nr:kinetoplast-associated protein-like protein [Leishmania braziliensis MHOM/BR/75/M2904]CAM36888.2 kinetoplast-associated protein-like protein [Leishmania braziliensis MHOM/BR/75/M2904]